MLLSWHRKRNENKKHPSDQLNQPNDAEKKITDFATDDDEDDDVVVYDRQSSNGDEPKKPSALTWVDIRSKLTSHRKSPATDAEKAVLNQPIGQYSSPVKQQQQLQQQQPQQQQQQERSKSNVTTASYVTAKTSASTGTDDEIEHVDIETNINNQPDQLNSRVFNETTVEINEK